MDSRLYVVLRDRGLLRGSEETLMRSAEVCALTPEAQLDYLKQNRSVGVFVVLFAGGVRVLLIAGGLLSIVLLTAMGDIPLGWWQAPVCLVVTAFLVWAVRGLRDKFREQSSKLPSYETLREEIEST